MKRGINHELKRYHLVIEGTLTNPKIMQALAKQGYDRKEILRGKDLLLNAENQQHERENEKNAQKEATRHLHAAQDNAYALYMHHLKFARLTVQPESKPWDDMKLGGARSKDLNGWLVQAAAFYRNIGPVADMLIQNSSITADDLTRAQGMIAAVTDAQVKQNLSKSNYQKTKLRRDNERKALKAWMSKFIKTVRFAFDEDKQQLEALGIVVA